MIWGRKHKNDGQAKSTGDCSVARDKALIDDNVKALGVVAVQLESSPDYVEKIKDIIAKYEYVSPRQSAETIDADKKIADRIGDLRIIASKMIKDKRCDEIDEIIQKIKILIAER